MYGARDLIEYGEDVSKETKQVLKHVSGAFDHYYKLYYNFSLPLYTKISEQRTIIRNDFRDASHKLKHQEIKLLTYFDQAIELLFQIAGARTSIEF